MLLGGATYFLEGFDNLTETHLVMMVFDSNISFILSGLVQWFVMMFNASVLTTIYGVAIEYRELM